MSNTTLDPKPTDREREMLAEWAIRFCTMQHELNHPECTLSECFDYAESMLMEFRTRYGVTGAEPEPIRDADITLKDFHSVYIESFKTENSRLREALSEIAHDDDATMSIRLTAHEALKGGSNESM